MPLDEHSADRAAATDPGSEPPAPSGAVAPAAAASRAQIDCWVAEGRYAEAAAALRTHGELAAAQELLERIWDYPAALAVAAERGDLLAQLRLSLLSGDLALLARLRTTLAAASDELRRRAAATLEQHQQPAAAAELYEAAGQLTDAQRCYEQAGHHQGSARLHERSGQLSAAVRAYERLLASSLHDPTQQAQAQAQRGLGRILQQLGRHEEAVRHLQQARALLSAQAPQSRKEAASAEHHAPDAPAEHHALDEIEVALVRSLAALSQARIAQPILLAYTARHPDEPAAQTVAEFIARHPAPAPPTNASRAAPVLLERYELVRLLGSGGMGRVYLAEDRLTGRPVALKLLPTPGLAAEAASAHPGSPAELLRRFVREAQLLGGLRHPNIVQLLAFHPEAAVLVLEYLPGGSLAQRPLPLSPAAVQRVLLEVLAGLAAAHAAGVLHRDLKPHNLLCSATGETRLGDFGAAYLQALGATRTESYIGTLAYMAPEQLSGQPLSFATDLYALAVTAFQLLTGRLPFAGPDFIAQHLHATPPDPRTYVPTLDAAWSALLRRALHKSPAERHASLDQMRDEVLALPVDLTSPRPARAAVAPSPTPPAPARPPQVFLEGASPILHTPYSTVVLGLDVRLGRPVLVEKFHPAPRDTQALAAQLRWLRALAGLAGPGLQRILRINESPDPEPASENAPPHPTAFAVHYEVPVGPPAGPATPLTPSDLSLLRRTLRRLHAAGLAHGAVSTSVLCEPAAALLLVHGRGPLGFSAAAPPSAHDDLTQLEQLRARSPLLPND